MSAPLDKAGQEIHVGDYIVYGHALGRCAGLRFGRVVWITEKEPNHRNEPKHHFTVRGIDDDWGGKIAKLNDRKGTLQFAERILVIDKALLPTYYVALLSNLPELVELTCQDCKKVRFDTASTTCPYSEDVNDTRVDIQVCPDCYHERVMNI